MKKKDIFAIALCLIAGLWLLTFRRSSPDQLNLTDGKMTAEGTAVLPVVLKTSSQRLSAIEWQIAAPLGATFTVNTTLHEKFLRCKAERCILFGGQTPIRSGLIASLTLHVPGARHLPVSIALVKVMGAENDGSRRIIAGSTATIAP